MSHEAGSVVRNAASFKDEDAVFAGQSGGQGASGGATADDDVVVVVLRGEAGGVEYESEVRGYWA